MQAMVISEPGGPEVLQIQELPDPTPGPREVLIRVEAFGINHAETHMRKGEWPEATPVSGIEAVGTVVADTSRRLAAGQKVATVMGGLGRTRNGSYAEYTVASSEMVVPIETDLSWTDLAAVPESYATAWITLHDNLKLTSAESLLIRGATSALGLAALNIASDLGATVIATTRRQGRAQALLDLGARKVIIDNGEIADQVREHAPGGVDAVLDLVGNSVLRDSLRATHARGRVCQAGFLGGLAPVQDFVPMFDLPSGVQLSFFGSFELGTEAFPLSQIPLQSIVSKVQAGDYKAAPVKVFTFDDIAEAHVLMERSAAFGKMVVAGVGRS
jgi:NADPH2:quinone reductase